MEMGRVSWSIIYISNDIAEENFYLLCDKSNEKSCLEPETRLGVRVWAGSTGEVQGRG